MRRQVLDRRCPGSASSVVIVAQIRSGSTNLADGTMPHTQARSKYHLEMTVNGPPHSANWYADPWLPGQLRYWDGQAWTPHVAHGDPIQAPPDPAASNGALPDTEASLAQAPAVEATEPDWHDLAENPPGQAARKKAVELRQAAPVKTLIFRVFNAPSQERAFRVGAEGEEEVARRLRGLGDGWHVIHAVPVGEKDSDIDHVVIGPPGVFTLNTKNHSKGKVWVAERAFMVNGQKTDYLRNSRHEANRAKRLLSSACGFPVTVEPVIVVMAADLTIKDQPPDVHVVARKRITKWLIGRPPMLSPEAIEIIYGQARRSTTWRTGADSRGER